MKEHRWSDKTPKQGFVAAHNSPKLPSTRAEVLAGGA